MKLNLKHHFWLSVSFCGHTYWVSQFLSVCLSLFLEAAKNAHPVKTGLLLQTHRKKKKRP